MNLRAVLFDLDNTLVPEMANYELAFDDVCRQATTAHRIDLESLRRAVFGHANELWEQSATFRYCSSLGIGSPTSLLSEFPGDRHEFATLRDWAPGYRLSCWRRGLSAHGIGGDADKLAGELDAAFRARIRSHYPPYPDALPALERLSNVYRLAVLTNGPIDVQLAKLSASGLEHFFSVVVASSEVGYGKPDPRLFTAALERLGVDRTDAVAIGDSPERDVAGARASRIRCVWLNRERSSSPASLTPDFEIRSLDELPDLLSKTS